MESRECDVEREWAAERKRIKGEGDGDRERNTRQREKLGEKSYRE
jgi:endogenous inhibitor of DNA gyrase (YacG/DUF329 family)